MQLTEKKLLNHALLISISTPQFKGNEAKESLAELSRLVTTLGFKVVGTQSQRQNSTQKVNVLGEGKLVEIARLTGNKGEVIDNNDGKYTIDEDAFDIFITFNAEEKIEFLSDAMEFGIEPAMLKQIGKMTEHVVEDDSLPIVSSQDFISGGYRLCVTTLEGEVQFNSDSSKTIRNFG